MNINTEIKNTEQEIIRCPFRKPKTCTKELPCDSCIEDEGYIKGLKLGQQAISEMIEKIKFNFCPMCGVSFPCRCNEPAFTFNDIIARIEIIKSEYLGSEDKNGN